MVTNFSFLPFSCDTIVFIVTNYFFNSKIIHKKFTTRWQPLFHQISKDKVYCWSSSYQFPKFSNDKYFIFVMIDKLNNLIVHHSYLFGFDSKLNQIKTGKRIWILLSLRLKLLSNRNLKYFVISISLLESQFRSSSTPRKNQNVTSLLFIKGW